MAESLIEVHLSSEYVTSDALTVVALRGREAISALYWFDIDVVAESSRLPEAVAVGERMTLTLLVDQEPLRRIHGVVERIESVVDSTAERPVYRLRLGPRARLAALVQANMVFVDMGIPDVLRHKLPLVGYDENSYDLRLFERYNERELVVQYDETDLAFFSRLTEHHGISFWFEHAGDREMLVAADRMEAFPALEGVPPLRARRHLSDEQQGLLSLRMTDKLLPAVVLLDDYNDVLPQLELFAQAPVEGGFAGGVVEYGAHYATPPEGAQLAAVRAQELSCRRRVYSGATSIAALTAGHTVSLDEHAAYPADELLLTAVEHELTARDGGDTAAGAGGHYRNAFEAVSVTTMYRPARRTPRPRIAGVITGFVQRGLDGEIGGTSQLDERGRYRVEMHFAALLTEAGSKPSRYMRMAHPYGGANQGMHFPLRPGTEVLVAFINGDPDRPVIVGAVHNGMTPSPVTAREASTHRLRTNSGVKLEIWERS